MRLSQTVFGLRSTHASPLSPKSFSYVFESCGVLVVTSEREASTDFPTATLASSSGRSVIVDSLGLPTSTCSAPRKCCAIC